MICDWEEFKADTEKLFMKCLEGFTREKSQMVKTINYTGVGPFIPSLRRTLLKFLSYIGSTNVLFHLFYCNRLEDNICNLCTRLICNSPVLVDSFQKLESLSLPALMVTTHEDFKKIFSIFNCRFQEQEISINCFIDYRRVNQYKNDSKEHTNFADSNSFGANHPILIFNHMLTVGSRIAMNILRNMLRFFLASQWRTTVLIREIGVFIVDIIKIICKQYFKHFWYGGNISGIDVNNSILVLSKKETKKISSKLVSSLGYRFKRIVKCFHEVWLDSLYRVHLVISNSEFLDDDQKDLIKLHTQALLVYNRKFNPNFWITCLPYLLRK